ncbi:BRO-N domain-containing protein [Chitinolyticbacter meiyuanensis]|uniref:BRO-N domain-containing protein n=1 Tax=Chitinolyticbacter meiyuanensis TaxID=682798 RepID=UPI0011E5A019|nr:Bro-N domain-containing protein [Chitinolyticbacter meiyuanensis]
MAASSTGTPTPAEFNFTSQKLRVIVRDGEPWFVAADVCAALGIGNTSDALRRLDDDEQALVSIEGIHGSAGNPTINVVNESGLYSLILGSRKPEAKHFKKWVTSEVLPAIRKTGRFEAAPAPHSEQLSSADQRNLQRVVWWVCDQHTHNQAWRLATWQVLRQAADCPAPQRFEVHQLPLLAGELRRILEISEAVREHCRVMEAEAIRRVVRGGEPAAEFVDTLRAAEAAWLNQSRPWQHQLQSWLQQDLAALAERRPPAGSDHSGYADPHA